MEDKLKLELIFLFMGFLISRLSGKHPRKDCICGELLGIGFLIVIAFILYMDYGLCSEPIRVAKLLLLGYLPGRVIDWLWSK